MKFRHYALCISSFLPAFVASAALSAKSYVDKGLIAHWDGIENVSYGGAHNNDATTWTELTGNGPNISNPTSAAFVDSGLQTVRAYGTQVLSEANYKKSGIMTAFAAAKYTFEIAYNKTIATPNATSGYAKKICEMLAVGAYNRWMGSMDDNQLGMNPNNAGVEYNLAGSGNYVTVGTTVRQHSFSCSQDGATCVVRADNTVSKTTTTTTTASPVTTAGFLFNRGYGSRDLGLDGVYHAIRIYNRALSADEVAVNYAVDAVRYFGADAAAQSLPDGWRFDTTDPDDVVLEKRLAVYVKNGVGGTISMNGGSATTETSIWCEQGGTVAVTLTATAADGYAFVGWAGLDDAIKYNASVSASINDDVYAVFRKMDGSEPVAYSWKGAADADWNAAASWADTDGFAGVPVTGDSVTIPAGATAMMTNSSPRFAAVTVAGTLVMTNWTTCLNADAVTVPNGGTLTCGAATTNKAAMSRVWVNCTDLTIASGGKIDVNYKGYKGLPMGTDGYNSGYGPGAAGKTYNLAPSHGGYGALKMTADYPTYRNILPYDDPAAPVEPGSSGIKNKWGTGGSGGGAVMVTASGAVTIGGDILADGENCYGYGKPPSSGASYHAGPGSGGSVFITCSTITGSGKISANGGGGDNPGYSQPGMSAGGGCIAIHYDTVAQTASAVSGMKITADAGHYSMTGAGLFTTTCVNADTNRWEADVGTLHFSDAKILDALLGNGLCGQIRGIASYSRAGDLNFTYGHVRFAEEGASVSIGGDLTMGGTASRLEIGGAVATNRSSFVDLYAGTEPSRLTVGGDLTLGGSSRLDVRAASTNETDAYGAYVKVAGTMTVGTNCFVYAWSDVEAPSSPHFEVGSLNVATGGTFSAARRGGRHSGSDRGASEKPAAYLKGLRLTANGAGGDTSGGGHGGLGGRGQNTSGDYGRVYDDELRPHLPGSGAGRWNVNNLGGYGGGAILVSATNGMIRIDGEVNADGESGTAFCNGLAGGGSGGTIFFESRFFAAGETAVLSAKGGNTKPLDTTNSMGAGGGGRIAVWCGEPYEEGLPRSRVSQGTSPIAGEGDAEFFSFAGSYSVAGGVPVGTDAESWADRASGGAGTVWFARVKERGGLCVIIK